MSKAPDHLFTEFHEDEEIGRLLWRISRRAAAIYGSQDGLHIMDMERKQVKDREELDWLLEKYNGGHHESRCEIDPQTPIRGQYVTLSSDESTLTEKGLI